MKIIEHEIEYNRIWLQRKFSELIQYFGGQCWFCGSKVNLEFAHFLKTNLKGAGRGKQKRYYDIKNHPLSYGLLCSDCHREYDYKKKQESENKE